MDRHGLIQRQMDIHGTVYRQEDDPISLLLYFQYKETRLKKANPVQNRKQTVVEYGKCMVL
jgi:hypothetical protein